MTRNSDRKQTYSYNSHSRVLCDSMLRDTSRPINLNMATFDNWDFIDIQQTSVFSFLERPRHPRLKNERFLWADDRGNVLYSSYLSYFILFPILPYAGTFKWFSVSIRNLFHLLRVIKIEWCWLQISADYIRFKLEVKVWSQLSLI